MSNVVHISNISQNKQPGLHRIYMSVIIDKEVDVISKIDIVPYMEVKAICKPVMLLITGCATPHGCN